MSNKQIIYDGAFRFKDISKSITLTDFAYRILTEFGGIDSQQASEYVSKYQKSIRNNFNQQNDILQRRGITGIGNITFDTISWNSSSVSEQSVWKIRPYCLEIIENLNDTKFESLCCNVFELMGGQAWRTKTKGDGNVDLYGIASTKMNNHIFGINSKFRVVGQCKNYSHRESITNFESFYHALNNVKFLNQRVSSEIPNEFTRQHGAILGWYICKDGFQSGIHMDAKNQGIILSDKYDLVEVLTKMKLDGLSSFEVLLKLNINKGILKHS